MLDGSSVTIEVNIASVPLCKQRRGATLGRICAPYLLVALGVLLYLRPFMRVLWRHVDEGILLEGAQRVTEGQLPGRDFLECIGPGSFYWMAGFFHLFGTSITTARGLLLGTGVGVALAVFHLARRANAHPILCAVFFVVTAIPPFPINTHHLDGDMFCLFALCAFVEWQRRESVLPLAGCGVLAAAATLMMQSKGLLFLMALALSTVLVSHGARKRVVASVTWLVGPYVVVLAGVAAFYFFQGALNDLIWANFTWPVSRYLGINSCPYAMFLGHHLTVISQGMAAIMPGRLTLLAATFIDLPLLIVAALPVLLISLVAWLRTRAFASDLIPFWSCGIALWLSELHHPDNQHLAWGSAILLVLASALFRRITNHPGVPLLCFASLFVLAAIYVAPALSARTPIETRRGQLFGQTQDQVLQFLLKNTRPGDDIFIYPHFPNYYFLSGTRNPTRLSFYVHGWNPPEQFREAAPRLEAKHVRFVLWDPGVDDMLHVWLPRYKTAPANEQIIEPYLESHYHQLGSASTFRIMERNP
jgi:hypothetical protein